MWLWVLLIGLGMLAFVVCISWMLGRRARRLEHQRVWEQHQTWVKKNGQDGG